MARITSVLVVRSCLIPGLLALIHCPIRAPWGRENVVVVAGPILLAGNV